MIHWPGFIPEPLVELPLDHWFSTEGEFAPWGHLVKSGDIFDCCTWSDATGIWLVETRDIVSHPTMYPHSKELWPKMLTVPKPCHRLIRAAPLIGVCFSPKHITSLRCTGTEHTLGLSHSPCQPATQGPQIIPWASLLPTEDSPRLESGAFHLAFVLMLRTL